MTSCNQRREDRHMPPLGWAGSLRPECREERRHAWAASRVVDTVRPKNFDVPFISVLENAKQLSLFVEMDGDVLGGTPRIGGTRIAVHRVLDAIDEYESLADVTKAYRSLTIEQVHDAVQFAARVLEFPVEHETEIAG